MTKTEFTNKLNALDQYEIKTFNYHKKMPTGAAGFVDHVLMHKEKGYVIFIEFKSKYDALKPDQVEFKEICINAMKQNGKFIYYLVDSDIVANIVLEDLGKL